MVEAESEDAEAPLASEADTSAEELTGVRSRWRSRSSPPRAPITTRTGSTHRAARSAALTSVARIVITVPNEPVRSVRRVGTRPPPKALTSEGRGPIHTHRLRVAAVRAVGDAMTQTVNARPGTGPAAQAIIWVLAVLGALGGVGLLILGVVGLVGGASVAAGSAGTDAS